MKRGTALMVAIIAFPILPTFSAEIIVDGPAELKAALAKVAPGSVLKIKPGEYGGGQSVTDVAGLTIEAADPANPPVFTGGAQAWHFSRCEGLTLRHVVIAGQKMNGINLDDGGRRERPVKGVTLEHVQVRDIGPQGNHDGIKISGLEDLTIRNCRIEGWAGQGIDFVGCHRVSITGCELKGKEGFSQGAGIQMKGGSSDITITGCSFLQAGPRPLNMGGSTGMDYFRPPGAKYEARNLIVKGNIFQGGDCAAAFVGLDGGEFSGNQVLFPAKWIFRILQETKAEGFAPCRNVLIRDNRIVFRRAQVKVEVNIGEGTDAGSFRFERNRWFAEDKPEASKPKLPSEETDAVYGSDPR